MKRRIDVGAGIGHHVDAADVEAGALAVMLLRRFATQEVAHDRRRQATVGHDTVFDGVAEIDQSIHVSHPASHKDSAGTIAELK